MTSKWKTVRISQELLNEITETVKNKPLWINEHDFVREAIREKINKTTECKLEA